jgi:DNA-binding HxlR family transcriptional regulator
MPAKRTYAEHGDACAAAHAMDLVGDRWSMIIARELTLGPKRFNELLQSVHGITPAVLTARLRELERTGIVDQYPLPAPARVMVYDLTDWGQGLEPILRALGRWAHGSPSFPTGGDMTPDAVVLAMRTMAPTEPVRHPIAVQLCLADGRARPQYGYDYRLRWADADLTIERGVHPNPSATVTADATVWSQVIFGGLAITAAQRKYGLAVTGDRMTVRELINAFRS